MAIQIKIVIDPFAGDSAGEKYRATKEQLERNKREAKRQREIDERYRQKAIDLGLIRPQDESDS